MAQTPPATAALLDQFGPKAVLTDADAKAAYTLDWRGKYPSDALAVVRPDSTAMVADVVRLCAKHDVAITPQGGNTGLVGGSVPTQPRREIVLSLDRMNAVEDVDAVGNTMLVQTGCILAHAQQAAEAEDRLFPLSLGAEGTCRIGGNLSTNAGGINVLKYGNMRDLVLGLEVVLADGRVWNGLNRLRKDNTGYDLKHLFIGAEGSLGIITRAVLKLFPRPRDRVTLWLACADPAQCLATLNAFRGRLGEAVMAGEIMPRIAVEQALSLIEGLRAAYAGHAALVTAARSRGVRRARSDQRDHRRHLAGLHDRRAGTGRRDRADRRASARAVADPRGRAGGGNPRRAVDQARRLRPRCYDPDADRGRHGAARTSLPGQSARARRPPWRWQPALQPVCPAEAMGDPAREAHFLAAWGEINAAFHDLVGSMGGSISAEHGIGQLKKDELVRDGGPRRPRTHAPAQGYARP